MPTVNEIKKKTWLYILSVFSGRLCASGGWRPRRTSSPGPGWILNPSPATHRHLHLPSPFLFALIGFLLCTLNEYSPLSLLSVCLFLSIPRISVRNLPPYTLWQLPCIVICCSSLLATTYTVTITIMYKISQLFQHEKHRIQPGIEVVKASSESLSL